MRGEHEAQGALRERRWVGREERTFALSPPCGRDLHRMPRTRQAPCQTRKRLTGKELPKSSRPCGGSGPVCVPLRCTDLATGVDLEQGWRATRSSACGQTTGPAQWPEPHTPGSACHPGSGNLPVRGASGEAWAGSGETGGRGRRRQLSRWTGWMGRRLRASRASSMVTPYLSRIWAVCRSSCTRARL